MIRVENLTKSYGPVVCLSDVSVTCEDGSVHALTGENGAGKSTLMKLIGGVIQPNSGRIFLDDREVRFANPREALMGGISTVFQEFSLIENMTVAESVFLGHERANRGFLRKSEMYDETRKVLDHVGLDISPKRMISTLTVAEQQMVEIARGVSANAKVFIFDEPTAALGDEDVRKLKNLIRELQASGKNIFYVSHRLEEIFDLCDTITVLKDGEHVITKPAADLNVDSLVTYMVGREMGDWFPAKTALDEDLSVSVEDLKPIPGAPSVSLQVRKGEILGLAGLEGQGQQEILRALAGVFSETTGSMTSWFGGKKIRHKLNGGVREQVARGVAFVPEDRKKEGLYLTLPIDQNIALGQHQKRGIMAFARRTRDQVLGLMGKMNVSAFGPEQIVETLSGGNQQKVMLGRWMASDAHVFLIEEPTRGVDIGAKAEIYQLLRDLVAGGKSAIVLSREMNELIGLCDRILVVRSGKIVAEMDPETATEHSILRAAIAGEAGQEMAA
jgi:ribose transport system ATP-binding protein